MSAPPLPEVFGNYALGEFVEVVPPDAISWMPQTIGWLWLGAAVIAFALRYAWRKLQYWHKNRYRREAVSRLKLISPDPSSGHIIPKLNQLLKLVALVAYPREKVARLSGRDWAEFLNGQCSDPVFSPLQSKLLAMGSYSAIEVDQSAAQLLLASGLRWINEHRGTDDV